MSYLERDLAKKFLYIHNDESGSEKPKLRPVVRISIIGIALGIMLILISFFIIRGFKGEVRHKLDGFLGNVKISNPDNIFNQYIIPLDASPEVLREVTENAQMLDAKSRVFTFIDQMGMIKSDSAFKGVVFHSVDSLYNYEFYEKYLVAGEIPRFNGESTTEFMLSKQLAEHLNVNVGDRLLTYFYVGDQLKVRKFDLVGLFDTGFPEYDEALAIADIRSLRSVGSWDENQVGGIEVHTSKHSYTKSLFDNLYGVLADRNSKYQERYTMFTSEELNPSIFGWLNLLDANVYLILGLMIAVAGMTIITGIVVLILEKIPAIATLKALGYGNRQLRTIFRNMGLWILLRGMLWGNIIAIIIGMIQKIWKPIKLDPVQYYTAFAPVQIDVITILGVNVAVFILVMLMILIPSGIVSHIMPAKTLRFE